MRVAPAITPNPEQRQNLEATAHARSLPARLVERSRIVLMVDFEAERVKRSQANDAVTSASDVMDSIATASGGLSFAIRSHGARAAGRRLILCSHYCRSWHRLDVVFTPAGREGGRS